METFVFDISMLYKRAFGKGKEVITFLVDLLKRSLTITGEAPSLMRRLKAGYRLAK
jgi:hypothetical protein